MDNIDYEKLEEAERNLTKQLLDEKKKRDIEKQKPLYKAGGALLSIAGILLLNLIMSALLLLGFTDGSSYYLIIIMLLVSCIIITIKFYKAGVYLQEQ